MHGNSGTGGLSAGGVLWGDWISAAITLDCAGTGRLRATLTSKQGVNAHLGERYTCLAWASKKVCRLMDGLGGGWQLLQGVGSGS